MKWSDKMKIAIENSPTKTKDTEKEDESILADLCKELLENGIESIIKNGVISLKMPLALFMELGLDTFLEKGMER